jgi:DNA-binding NarL/FixJ family response regulator
MDNQYVTIKGMYRDGQFVPLSTFLPKGSFQVLITFLEPIIEEEVENQKAMVALKLSPMEINDLRLRQFGVTDRELAILQLVQKGLTNREISEKLRLGDGTIRNYISSLLTKIKANNRTQLVTLAIEKGLLHSQ